MNLHGPVRASESAGEGSAALSITFDAWKEGHVAPSSHTVKAVRPKALTKTEPVSPRLIRSLVHPYRNSAVTLLKFSADGQRLAVAGYPSGIVQIWDLAADKELSRIETPPGLRGTADYVSLTGDWKTAYVPHDGRKVVRIEKDGEKQATIDYNGEVRVWDLTTRKPRSPIAVEAHHGVSQAIVSPDGTKLITAESIAYNPKGAKFVPHATVFRDLTSKSPPIELATGFAMTSFAPDGKTFALATNDRELGSARLRLFDSSSGKETALLGEDQKASYSYPVFSPNGKRVLATVGLPADSTSILKIWSTSGGEATVCKPDGSTFLSDAAFSPDGRFVAASTHTGAGYVWDAATGKVVLTHRFGEKGFTRGMAVSPDGRLAAAVGIPGLNGSELRGEPDPADLPQPRVILYDLTNGKVVDTLVCPHGYPGRIVFSPDGKTLAVGGSGAVHLIQVK